MIAGAIYMTITFFLVALFGVFLKIGQVGTTAIWMTFIAYLVAYVIAILWVIKNGIAFLKSKRVHILFLRALFGVTATLLYVLSLQYIPLLNATLLFNTTPLFVPIFSIFVFRLKVSWKIWLAILVGFIGIVFIIRPSMEELMKPGDLLGLASGISLALAFVTVKSLLSTEPMKRINFYFFGFGSLLCLPFIFFSTPYASPINWAWGVGTGVCFILCQIFLMKAYQKAEVHEVGVFQYTSVVFAGLFDWILWNKTPSILTLIGVILVIIGGALVIWLSPGKKTNSSSSKQK